LATPSSANDFVIPFNLTWEPDVFGGVRRGVESANAAYQASAAALENVRLVVPQSWLWIISPCASSMLRSLSWIPPWSISQSHYSWCKTATRAALLPGWTL